MDAKPKKPFPSREDIVAFIARERAEAEKAGAAKIGGTLADKIGKREIARAFAGSIVGTNATSLLAPNIDSRVIAASSRLRVVRLPSSCLGYR